MNKINRDSRRSAMMADKLRKLADLIVSAKPVELRFESEEQFLDMLNIQAVPVRSTDRSRWPS